MAGRTVRAQAVDPAPQPSSHALGISATADLRRARAPAVAHPALDASPNPVIGVDADGRIVYANPQVEPVFGWAPAELLGRPVEDLIPEALAASHVGHRRDFQARAVSRPMGIGQDLAARRRDGSAFPVEISLAPVMTADELTIFATVVDITTRTSLESQLRQAQRLESVGRLAGGIAHDFSNMLFAIRGHASLIADDLDAAGIPVVTVGNVARSLAAIDMAAERAVGLVRQLLAFSRQQVTHAVRLRLPDAVTAIEPMLQRLVSEDTTLVVLADPATGEIDADPSQIDQVLVNLVGNARDAMPGGGTITIETGNVVFDEPYMLERFEVRPGDYVMLAVTDTGVGMDHATQARIFEPFFTTKAPGQGTGLGLATVYGIVRQSGGHIWVYSEPGQGTKFKLYFPRAAAGTVELNVTPLAVPLFAGPAAGTVLLVEDDEAVRELTRTVLERGGFRVITPEQPLDALELVEPGGRAIDVLVSDMVMPGVSGRELALRTMASRPETAIVLLSGYTAETAAVEDLVARGARFASKPLSTGDLLALVRSALADKARERGAVSSAAGSEDGARRVGPPSARHERAHLPPTGRRRR